MKRYEHLPAAPPFVQAGGSAALLTFGANTYHHSSFPPYADGSVLLDAREQVVETAMKYHIAISPASELASASLAATLSGGSPPRQKAAGSQYQGGQGGDMLRLQLERPHGDQLEFIQVFPHHGEVLPSAVQGPYFFQAQRGGHSSQKTDLLPAGV